MTILVGNLFIEVEGRGYEITLLVLAFGVQNGSVQTYVARRGGEVTTIVDPLKMTVVVGDVLVQVKVSVLVGVAVLFPAFGIEVVASKSDVPCARRERHVVCWSGRGCCTKRVSCWLKYPWPKQGSCCRVLGFGYFFNLRVGLKGKDARKLIRVLNTA